MDDFSVSLVRAEAVLNKRGVQDSGGEVGSREWEKERGRKSI